MDIQVAYDILELSPGVTIDDVKKNHRKYIADWHPDKFQRDKRKRTFAEGLSKDLNCARDILVAYLSGIQNQGPAILTMNISDPALKHISYFVTVVFINDPSSRTSLEDIYFIYDIWCTRREIESVSLTEFMARMKDLGFNPISDDGLHPFRSVYWTGIKMNPEWEAIFENIAFPIIVDSDEPVEKHFEYSEMDDDDDLSEVVF